MRGKLPTFLAVAAGVAILFVTAAHAPRAHRTAAETVVTGQSCGSGSCIQLRMVRVLGPPSYAAHLTRRQLLTLLEQLSSLHAGCVQVARDPKNGQPVVRPCGHNLFP